jgi:prepilin-type N-terminal cleavage/methylation domain-containing protein
MCCGDCKARCTPRGRGGFTLIEMVVTMGVLALVMTVMTSIMLATAKAMPSAADADVALDADDRALREAAWLVADAKQITSNSINKLGFRVSDLDKDSADDEVTLTHGGNEGDALIMNVAGSEVELVKNVRTFTFEFQPVSVVTSTVSGTYDTSEMLLDGWNGPVSATRTCSLTRTLAMRLAPQLPHDATQYRITRARYFVKPVSGKTCAVGLSIADATAGGMPDITRVRFTVSTTITGLPAAGEWANQSMASNTYWHAASERPFLWAGTTNLTAQYEIGVNTLAPHAGEFVYQQTLGPTEIATGGAMLFEVYGVVRRPATTTTTRTVATALMMTVTKVDGTVVRATVPLRNEPEVP